ncbi:unnamed protein product [Pleuronectes platessa]|uniref:Uncharacterized protein n=1 Tax=Pleuronectes platessa TaxID=8262 RepID=A0A9N7YTX2_PLEPL|nr:unnamed protein product [Pleuronectes platessa]
MSRKDAQIAHEVVPGVWPVSAFPPKMPKLRPRVLRDIPVQQWEKWQPEEPSSPRISREVPYHRKNVKEKGGSSIGFTVQSIGGVVRPVAETPKPSATPWPQPPPAEVPPDTSDKRPSAGRPKPLLERSGNVVVANKPQDVVVPQEPDRLGPVFTVSFVFSL